jgi:AbrB family looped-hinge helix DNA binding protein
MVHGDRWEQFSSPPAALSLLLLKCKGRAYFMESALSSKGQTTVPKAVRDHLRLRPGDKVKFFFHPDGTVVLLPRIPTAALKGIVPGNPRHSVSVEEMEMPIAAETTADKARTSIRTSRRA